MSKVTNAFLAEFKRLHSQKSKVDKQLEDMKNTIKAELRAGTSKETVGYVASVRLDKSERIASKEECIRVLSEKFLKDKGLLVKTESRVVVVEEKETKS